MPYGNILGIPECILALDRDQDHAKTCSLQNRKNRETLFDYDDSTKERDKEIMEALARSRKGRRLIREGREDIWRQQQLVLTTKTEQNDGPVCTKSDPDGPYARQNIRRLPCENSTPIEISSDEDDDFFFIQGEDNNIPPNDEVAIVNSVKTERNDEYVRDATPAWPINGVIDWDSDDEDYDMTKCNDIIPSSPDSYMYGNQIHSVDTASIPDTNVVHANDVASKSTTQISDVKHDVLNNFKADSEVFSANSVKQSDPDTIINTIKENDIGDVGNRQPAEAEPATDEAPPEQNHTNAKETSEQAVNGIHVNLQKQQRRRSSRVRQMQHRSDDRSQIHLNRLQPNVHGSFAATLKAKNSDTEDEYASDVSFESDECVFLTPSPPKKHTIDYGGSGISVTPRIDRQRKRKMMPKSAGGKMMPRSVLKSKIENNQL